MTTGLLVACEGCARHVRASDASCPFCGAAVHAAARAPVARKGPTSRLGRAGLAALGVGVIALPLGLADCAESAQMAVYGAPPDLIESDAGHTDATPPAKPPPAPPAK